MVNDRFTIGDIIGLTQFIDAAIHCRKVEWMVDGTDRTLVGTVRGVTDENGNYAYEMAPEEACLWITTTTGLEVFMPLVDVRRRSREFHMIVKDD